MDFTIQDRTPANPDALRVTTAVCLSHRLQMEDGVEWLWVQPPERPGDAEVLLNDELRAHEEWVPTGEPVDWVSGYERTAEGSASVLTIPARKRGEEEVRAVRLVIGPYELNMLLGLLPEE